MRAVCWHGRRDVRVETIPDARMLDSLDAIVRVKRTAICGSDLHLYDGRIPGVPPGTVAGHEFMGEIIEIGGDVRRLQIGDRVLVSPFALEAESAGKHRARGDWHSLGHAPCASRAGSHAQYIRVPHADLGAVKIPDGVTDEQALPVSDAFPAGYTAAEKCRIRPGDTVAVWGAGAIGLLAMKSAWLFGAGRVIAIDRHPTRLRMAAESCRAETLHYERVPVLEALGEMTLGRGPDACIDAGGTEGDAPGLSGLADRAKRLLGLATDRPQALRQAIAACRANGTVSVIGAYGGRADNIPLGQACSKGITIRMGGPHSRRSLKPLLDRVIRGEIDPSFILTHCMSLESAPEAYRMLERRAADCVRVVLNPELV